MTASQSTSLRHRCRAALVATCAAALALSGVAFTSAQDSARSSISAAGFVNADGLQIGTVSASESDGAVTFTITVSNLTPGDHGMHIHETGTCDPATGFDSAGGHFNPEQDVHGPGEATVTVQVQPSEEELASPAAAAAEPSPEASPVTGQPSHAGDLGNLPVGDTGSVTADVTTSSVTLSPDATNSLADADGSALVIHADPDDLTTDPSGNSGDRLACAVLFAPTGGGAAASPAASPAAEVPAAGAAVSVEATDDLRFAPDTITVSPGDTITVTNTGVLEHDFVVEELGLKVALPNGEPVEVTIPADAAPGDYEFFCSVPGHEPAGMKGTLTVQ